MAEIKQPVDLIKEVADAIKFEYDFPYCFYIPTEDGNVLVFGYADDSLGYNLTTKDGGEVLESGELTDEGVPVDNQDVDAQVRYIRKYCQFYHAVGVEPLGIDEIADMADDDDWQCPECGSMDIEVRRYDDGRCDRVEVTCCDCDWEVEG